MLHLRLGLGAIALGLLPLGACSSDPVVGQSNPFPSVTSATTSTSTGSGGEGGATSGTGGAGGDTTSAGGGGSTATSSTTGTGGSGTGGSTSTCNWTPPVLAAQGQADRILLQGMIVTPDQAFDGEVLIVGDLIVCVAASCANDPQAANASIVKTNGIVMPGLIDTHNHILFNVFDETDWSPTQTYTNHDQWPNDLHYKALVDAKQYLNGEFGSALDLGCEMNKHGELRGLIAGTTSIAGSANPANKKCYGSLSRTIDQTSNDLPSDDVQSATIFPTKASADGVCTNFGTGNTTAYLIHIGEGVDQTSLNEFAALGTVTTTDFCLYAPQTTIVHGTALGDAELTTMATNGMSLTWSPRSNVFLYGAGTDLSMTTNIPLALAKGLNVSIAPDWSIGGSQNMLDEMRFANAVDDGVWGDGLTSKDIVAMSTTHPAKALGLEAVLGSLEVGKKADVVVIAGDAQSPYDAILAATPADVQLVLVGGVALYGDEHLQPLGPASPGCEAITICCGSKFLCVAEATSTDKLDQTLGAIEAALTDALAEYDAQDLTQWDFSPITPLVTCAP